MRNFPDNLYRNLYESDAEDIKQSKEEFESILGMSFDDDLFAALYTNAKYFPDKNIVPGVEWDAYHIRSRGKLGLASTALYQKFTRLNVDENFGSQQSREIAKTVAKQGYCVVDNFLSEDTVNGLLEELTNFNYSSPMNRSETVNLKDIRAHQFEELKENSRTSKYTTKFTGYTMQPDSYFGRLLLDPFMWEVSANFFQCHSFLASMTGFHTSAKDPKYFSQSDVHGSAQNWHTEIPNLRFLRFFIYLTDTSTENGAHCFVSNTHDDGLIYPDRKEDFCETAFRVYDNGQMGGYVKDEWVERNVDPERIIAFNAPKGTLIVENTTGLHKAGRVRKGTREMLDISYAISNLGNPHTMPLFDYVPTNPYNNYLSPVLTGSLEERIKKYDAFKAKQPFMKKITRRFKALAGSSN